MTADVTPDDVLDFWIGAGPEKWFEKDDDFDREIQERFALARDDAVEGTYDGWMDSAKGALALIILIDQFSRNLFRGSPRAYEGDARGLQLAEAALARGFDEAYENPLRRFFYIPFMHTETEAAQQRCIALCQANGDEDGLKHAREHAEIITRFGRFPHRNALLGRATTPAERKFLDEGGFSG